MSQLSDLTVTHATKSKTFIATQAGSAIAAATWQLNDATVPTANLPYLSFLANRKNRGSTSRDKGSLLLHLPKVSADGLSTSNVTFQVISNIPRDRTSAEVVSDYELLLALLATPQIKESLVRAITPH